MSDNDDGKALEAQANAGDVNAQLKLADCLLNGYKGFDKDQRKAVKWLRRAVELDSDEARVKLGECYEEGYGVEPDFRKAAKYYRLAAENEHTQSQYNVAECYEFGVGVDIDPKAALEWYKRAAKANHSEAQRKLGHCYEHGIGVVKDTTIAVEYFQHSADQGNAAAICTLGYCYRHGIGVSTNASIAIQLYKRSAELDHPAAYHNVGFCYLHGFGVEKDYVQALAMFNKASDKGYSPSQYYLGYMYENGIGVDKNLEDSSRWYIKSAGTGYLPSQLMAAYFYDHGLGVEKNSDIAKMWYNQPDGLLDGKGGDGKKDRRLRIRRRKTISSSGGPPGPQPTSTSPTQSPNQPPARALRRASTTSKDKKPRPKDKMNNSNASKSPSSSNGPSPVPRSYFSKRDDAGSEARNIESLVDLQDQFELIPGIQAPNNLYASLIEYAGQLPNLCDAVTSEPTEMKHLDAIEVVVNEIEKIIYEQDSQVRPALMERVIRLLSPVQKFREAALGEEDEESPEDGDIKANMFKVLGAVSEFTKEIEKIKVKSAIVAHDQAASDDADSSTDLTERGFRDKVLTEVIITEKIYLEGMEMAMEMWMKPMQESVGSRRPLATTEQINSLFANLQLIYSFNGILLTKIKENKENLGETFLKMADMMTLYIDYVNKYDTVSAVYHELWRSNKQFRAYDEEVSKKAKTTLISILITPVQRLPRYQMFLEALSKNTSNQHKDYENLEKALEKMRKVNTTINERKRDYENRVRLSQIQRLVRRKRAAKERLSLIAPHRTMIREGLLDFRLNYKKTHKRRGYVYIMNDIILLTEFLSNLPDPSETQSNTSTSSEQLPPAPVNPAEQKQFLIKLISLKDLSVKDESNGDITLVSGDKSWTFFAPSDEDRTKWISSLHDAIKSYSSNEILDKLSQAARAVEPDDHSSESEDEPEDSSETDKQDGLTPNALKRLSMGIGSGILSNLNSQNGLKETLSKRSSTASTPSKMDQIAKGIMDNIKKEKKKDKKDGKEKNSSDSIPSPRGERSDRGAGGSIGAAGDYTTHSSEEDSNKYKSLEDKFHNLEDKYRRLYQEHQEIMFKFVGLSRLCETLTDTVGILISGQKNLNEDSDAIRAKLKARFSMEFQVNFNSSDQLQNSKAELQRLLPDSLKTSKSNSDLPSLATTPSTTTSTTTTSSSSTPSTPNTSNVTTSNTPTPTTSTSTTPSTRNTTTPTSPPESVPNISNISSLFTTSASDSTTPKSTKPNPSESVKQHKAPPSQRLSISLPTSPTKTTGMNLSLNKETTSGLSSSTSSNMSTSSTSSASPRGNLPQTARTAADNKPSSIQNVSSSNTTRAGPLSPRQSLTSSGSTPTSPSNPAPTRKTSSRRVILETPSIENTQEALKLFLTKLGYSEYFQPMIDNKIDSIDKVATLTPELVTKIGIKTIHKAKLLISAKESVANKS
eukprot:TRINITY_DN6081_c2_g2_i1.p1 TRINITY_DN6081_c2_g2~~TRINITY_DN6081_c2_g2_i1.p1  ORF type:complete len:1447 (+),score=418.11 TRINITY_DN6081_c2_g2_i1:24-4343(+)